MNDNFFNQGVLHISLSCLLQAFSGTEADDATSPFMKRPFCAYRGHSAHLLDVCWSKVSQRPLIVHWMILEQLDLCVALY